MGSNSNTFIVMKKLYTAALISFMTGASAFASNTSIAENGGVINARDFNQETSTHVESTERILAEDGHIGNTQNGDFFRYDLYSPGGVYSVALKCANGVDREEPSLFTIYVGGQSVGTGEVPSKGWGTYYDVVIENVVIEEGDFEFGLQIDNAPINIESFTFTRTGEVGDVPQYTTIPGTIYAKDYNKDKSAVNDRLGVEGGGNIGNTANEDKLVYDFTCLETGIYNIILNGANGKSDREDPSLASVSIDSEKVGQVAFESLGWGTYQNKTIGNVEISEGNNELVVVIDLEPINLMSITFEKIEGSAVDGVEAISNSEVSYFNLQGVRVSNPENGIYIRIQGDKVSKVVIR